MALSISQLISAAMPPDFQAKILSVGTTLGLVTTTWQPGGVTRTLIAILSQVLGQAAGTSATNLPTGSPLGADGLIATIAQGGFLAFASNVTTDPSVANADGSFPPSGNGWLDILADSLYAVQRPGAGYATLPVVLTNSSASTYGPFAAGTYRLVNPSTKATYANSASLTIGPSGDTTGTFTADVAGAAGTTVANALVPSSSLAGVSVKTSGGANSNTSTGGANAQSNAFVVAACRAKTTPLGPKVGSAGPYVYFATAGYAGDALTGGPITRARVLSNPGTGVVNVYLANASPVPGAVLPVGDVTSVNKFLQSNTVPTAITLVVQAAAELDVAISLDVYCPNANLGTVVADVSAAIGAFVNACPIGGLAGGAGALFGLGGDQLIGAIFKAVPYVQNVENMLINGGLDLPIGATQVPVITPGVVITVHGTG